MLPVWSAKCRALFMINQTHPVSPAVTNEVSLIAGNLNTFEICPSLNTSEGQIPNLPHRIPRPQMTRMVSLTRQPLGCTERQRWPTPGCSAPGVRGSLLTSRLSQHPQAEGLRVTAISSSGPRSNYPDVGSESLNAINQPPDVPSTGTHPEARDSPCGRRAGLCVELAVNAGAALGPQQAGCHR